MSKVRTSAYRQTPTPEGLKAIENGTLDYFDTEMYANFNTEVLEEYLEEKNRGCLLYTSPSPRDLSTSRMPSSA